jgi:Fe2+ transport system protein FeoA
MSFRNWNPGDSMTLADIPRGMLVCISEIKKLPIEKRDHLLAFGLTPGRWVEIKQHRPAVVVQVDYTELALEPEVARAITVETPVPMKRMRHLHRGAAAQGRRHARRRLFFRRHRKGRRQGILSRMIRRHTQNRDESEKR